MHPFPVEGLSVLSPRHSLLVCDIWGVVHNGVAVFHAAAEALRLHRAAGGRVVLLTNAPRPHGAVAEQLDRLGLHREAWDRIVTSGDLARREIAARGAAPLLHIGPERDLPLFEGLGAPRVPPEAASYIVCTGLHDDETETAEDYRPQLAALAPRGLPMISANPDLVVDRGGRLIPCAGALAALYADLGGPVIQTGKPMRPIYEAVLEAAAEAGFAAGPDDCLAIGDAIATDIAGASAMGWATLMVAGGIHAAHLIDRGGGLDLPRAQAWLAGQPARPRYILPHLVW